MFRLFSCVVAISLFVSVCAEEAEENVAKGKKIIGHGFWMNAMLDGRVNNVGYERPSAEPHFFVELGAIYNVSSIHVYAQKVYQYKTEGLNTPFMVSTYDKFVSLCDLPALRPWNIVGTNVTFTKKGDKKVLPVNKQVYYLIFWRETPNYPNTIPGMYMADIQAYGRKIGEAKIPKEPENGEVPPNYHKETRKEVAGQQVALLVEQTLGQWIPNNKHNDVAFGWHHHRINSMAVKRGKGRIIVIQGQKFIKKLKSENDYAELRKSFKHWLAKDSATAAFVEVTEKYKPGDILLISRDDKFDVEHVYKLLNAGTNSAVIGYVHKNEDTDDATLLVKKLEIEYQKHDGRYGPRDIYLQNLVNSSLYIPLEYSLEQAAKSWTLFRTEAISSKASWEDWDSGRVQELIQDIVKAYGPYMSMICPCLTRRYHSNPENLNAILNYNMLLKYQLGDKVAKLPGLFYAPGEVSDDMKPTTITVTINSPVPGSYYPVGGYAKAGEGFKWKVIKNTDETFKGQYIRINAQTDYLGSKSPLSRWPSVTQWRPLTTEGRMASPFGGPVYLQLPAHVNITIQFEHVYRYAWLDLMNPKSIETFDSELEIYKGIPWLVVVGDKMITQLTTAAAISGKSYQIERSANFYDNCIKLMHNYRGSKFDESRDEVFAQDVQITIGVGHSGYPFMGVSSWGLTYTKWNISVGLGRVVSIPHELGHNLNSRPGILRRGGEVTNNALIPVCFGRLLNTDAFGDGAIKCFGKGDKEGALKIFKSTEYVGPPVIYYCYLGRYFSDGLAGNGFSHAFENWKSLRTEETKTQSWLQSMCTYSGYNLLPFNELWNFPITEETKKICQPFQCFLPDDELTRQVPEKVDRILKAYGGKCIRDKPKRTEFKGDLMRGVDVRKPQYIFIKE